MHLVLWCLSSLRSVLSNDVHFVMVTLSRVLVASHDGAICFSSGIKRL